MRHFYDRIEGWFDWRDYYREIVREAPRGAQIVEVGAFKGKSTAFLAVEARNARKGLGLHIVDPFTGEDHDRILPGAEGVDLRAVFEANLAPVLDDLFVYAERSLDAAARFADGELFAVYLDGDHAREVLAAELDAFWPKIAVGGQIAGHDLDWDSVATTVDAWATRRGLVLDVLPPKTWRIRKPAPAPWSPPKGERSLLVVPVGGMPFVTNGAAEALMRVVFGARVTDAQKAHGFEKVDLYWEKTLSANVDAMRDHAALVALASGFSHLLFLDVDMRFPQDLLARILAHADRGIVSGLYFQRKAHGLPIAMINPEAVPLETEPGYSYDLDAPYASELRQVDAIGMGCALIPTEVFRRFARPWFRYALDRNGNPTITEDMTFCRAVKAVGCPIWLDPTIACGHEVLGVYGVESFKAWHRRDDAPAETAQDGAEVTA